MDGGGQHILHVIAHSCSLDTAQYLVDFGYFDPLLSVPNADGKTAAEVAPTAFIELMLNTRARAVQQDMKSGGGGGAGAKPLSASGAAALARLNAARSGASAAAAAPAASAAANAGAAAASSASRLTAQAAPASLLPVALIRVRKMGLCGSD